MSYDLIQDMATGKYSVRVTNSRGEHRWLVKQYSSPVVASKAGQREMAR